MCHFPPPLSFILLPWMQIWRTVSQHHIGLLGWLWGWSSNTRNGRVEIKMQGGSLATKQSLHLENCNAHTDFMWGKCSTLEKETATHSRIQQQKSNTWSWVSATVTSDFFIYDYNMILNEYIKSTGGFMVRRTFLFFFFLLFFLQGKKTWKAPLSIAWGERPSDEIRAENFPSPEWGHSSLYFLAVSFLKQGC